MSKAEKQPSQRPSDLDLCLQSARNGRISLSFVVAVAENGVIGREGGLPWRLSSDLKLFRRLTMGKPVLMGRRTWESLPKQPLDGRDNIVVTRDKDYRAEGALVVGDVQAAVRLGCRLASERGVDEIAAIGGAALYADLLDKVDRMYWTTVHGAPEGDTTFPPFDTSEWQTVEEKSLPRGPNDDFEATLKVLVRRQKEAQ